MAPSVRPRSLAHFIVPGRLDTRTGGYEYDRRIVAGLRARDQGVMVHEADLSGFTRELADVPDDAVVVVDGLLFGKAPDAVAREGGRLRFVALVHHPLALETGLEARAAEVLEAGERRALTSARSVVVTSAATAGSLASYGVPPSRVTVIEPGTEPAPLARGSSDGVLRLLAVGSIIPRKGHAVLVDALATMPQHPWLLTCVGSLDRDPAAADRLRAQIHARGIENRVRLTGEVDDAALEAHYADADLFVLPTFHEGYGMAVAEALARGLPVIGTPTGGIPALVGDAAGVIVPIGDVRALAAALAPVLSDAAVRARLAVGARLARTRLQTWDAAVLAFAAVLQSVDGP